MCAAEVVQAVRLDQDPLTEQQAVTLSAGGQGTGTTRTALHRSKTDILQNAQWKMAIALRLGATLDTGPRGTCAFKKEQAMDKSLTTHSFHP